MRVFVKKPIKVEAFQFGVDDVPSWFRASWISFDPNGDAMGCIDTLEGEMTFHCGDYVIKGVRGELYPCHKDIFEETYEEVNSSIS